MATVGGMVVNLTLNAVGLSTGLAKARSEMAAFASSVGSSAAAAGGANQFKTISTGATIAGLAMLGFGAASVRAATNFEYQMKLIRTQAGGTTDEVKSMSAALLDMAPSVMAGPEELAKGLFHIESVGIRGARALEILRTAAQGAAVGNADLETVTNALVAVQMSGIRGTTSFSEAMGVLNGIVGTGNLRMQDLAKSFSSGVLSTAKQFGLTIQDVGSAMATMADQGIPAEEASTRLRITIALLAAPTKIAEKQLASIGLTGRALADEMRGPNGLVGALRLLKAHMDAAGLDATEQSQLLKNAFGGSRSSAGILTLINSLDLMDQKMKAINEKSGSFAEDFAIASQTAKAHFDNFRASVEVLEVRLGNALLPVAKMFADVLGLIAQHTEVLVPLFLVLGAAITFAAVKALGGLVVGLAQAGVGFLQGIYGAGRFAAALGLVTPPAAAAAAAVGGVGVAATAAAATATTAVTGIGLGFSGLGGIMVATAEETAAATAGMGMGLDGLSGVMFATTAQADAYAAAMAAVAEAEAAAGASAAAAAPAIAATGAAMSGAAAAGGAAAGGIAAAGAAAGGAAGATGLLGGAMGGLSAAVSALILPITIVVAAWIFFGATVDKIANVFEFAGYLIVNVIKFITEAFSKIPFLGDQFKDDVIALQKTSDDMFKEMQARQVRIDAGDKAKETAAIAGGEIGTALGEGMVGAVDATPLNQTLIQLFGDTLAGVQAAAMQAGAADMSAYAKAIADNQSAPVDAFTALIAALSHAMTPAQEIARLVGQLQSTELAAGLASGDPAVVAAAEALKKHIEERLDSITDGAYSAGQKGAQAYSDAWKHNWVAVDVGGPDAVPKQMVDKGPQLDGQMKALYTVTRLFMGEKAALDLVERAMKAQLAQSNQLASVWDTTLKPGAADVAAAMAQFRKELDAGTSSIADQAAKIVSDFGGNADAIREVGRSAGADLMLAIANGIKSGRDQVNQAMTDLHTMLRDGWPVTRQIAFLMAQLTGADLAVGLASSDPLVAAQALATRKLITDQLDVLTNGAFSAGYDAAAAYTEAFNAGIAGGLSPDAAKMRAMEIAAAGAARWGAIAPTINVGQGQKDYLDWLKKLDDQAKTTGASLRDLAGDATSALTSAFQDIKAKADEYFKTVHDNNLKMLQDTHDQKNALLDLKAAREERPITRAQSALNFRMKEQEEARLRKAVTDATDPASRLDAIQALQNFLDQRHIDDMQSEADAAKKVIDAQKKANDKKYHDQVDAENKRYDQQKKDFDRQLAALERFLKHHPEMWASAQEKVLALLNSYGVTYTNVGKTLGKNFSTALSTELDTVVTNLKKLWDATNPANKPGANPGSTISPGDKQPGSQPGNPRGSQKKPGGMLELATGAWDLPNDIVAQLHAREMVLPPDLAERVRRGQGLHVQPMDLSSMRGNPRVPHTPPAVTAHRSGGGGTIIFKVGEEKLAEMTDRSLYIQDSIYGGSGERFIDGTQRSVR